MTVEENNQYSVIVQKLPIDILQQDVAALDMQHHHHHERPFNVNLKTFSQERIMSSSLENNGWASPRSPAEKKSDEKRSEERSQRDEIPILATTPASPNGTNTSRTLVAGNDSSFSNQSTTSNTSPKRHSSPMALDHSPNGPLKHRHTLQVPKASSSSSSSSRHHNNHPVHTSAGILATTSQSDDILHNRDQIAPVHHSSTPRRASISLGRRQTRSVHSDVHLDEIPQDEDSAKWTEAIRAKRASKRKKKEEEVEDEVLVGTKVDINHSNYVTMYNMLTGIRFVKFLLPSRLFRLMYQINLD
ncbi:Phosphatidylinositol-4-phosphate 5-kinase [Orbilia oligospora]|uniref:Phosphatidylinositol-4-phosphate 5-kinase n=1 Tax=Orbilia oligospora TaxID=2813651 RepID=A0A7C8K4E9_ORBOL|nr:Phosphatidylinositol-4-phosphate 5-kinase [Orbilia oligospora]